MAANSNTVKLNDRQWANLVELNKAVVEARDVFEKAATKFELWVEMQAEQADIAPALKAFDVDGEKKALTFSKPKPEQTGPQLVPDAAPPADVAP